MQSVLVVTTEIGGEELLGLGDGDVQLGLDVDPNLERTGLHVQHMAAEIPILREKVEVITGHIDRPGIERCPKPDQGPLDVDDPELALVGGGLEQVLP